MVPTSALHAYIGALPSWFWLSNLLCVAVLFNIRGLGRKSWGWLVVALPLLIIAIGNAILFYQATTLFAGKLSPAELVSLKVPTIVTTVLWGGIGVSLVVKWVISLGEELTLSIAMGVIFSFFLGVIPITLVGAAHLVFQFSNLPMVLGYSALVWCMACVVYQLHSNWPAIVKERAKRSGQAP